MGESFKEWDNALNDLDVDQSHSDMKDAEKLNDDAEVMFCKVKKAVQSLRAAADKLNEAWSDGKITRIGGTSVGVVGGVLTIIGGVATVMTLGAATPLLVTGISFGFIGAGTNIAGNIKESLINSKEIEKADSDLKKALDSIRNVKGTIDKWLEHKDISRLRNICKLAEANNWGKPVCKLFCMILLAAEEAYKESLAFAGPAAKFVASEAGNAGIKATGIAGAKSAGNAGAKSAGNAGAKSAGNAGAKPAGNAGAKSAGKAGAKSGGKAGAKSAGKAGAKSAGKASAKAAGKATAKAAGKASARAADDVLQAGIKAGGKLAGGLIIGISTVFLTWDIIDLGFTIRDLVEKKGSDAAKELKQKAEILENIMKEYEEEG